MVNSLAHHLLKGALGYQSELVPVVQTVAGAVDEATVVTTYDELEGYHIVRSMLRDVVSPKRVFIRDAQSYCAILLDNNNRKTICRLRFNNPSKLSLGLFNEKREEERVFLDAVDDIHNYGERLKASVMSLHKPDTDA